MGVCAFACGGGKPVVGKEDVSRAANKSMLMAFQWGHLLAPQATGAGSDGVLWGAHLPAPWVRSLT